MKISPGSEIAGIAPLCALYARILCAEAIIIKRVEGFIGQSRADVTLFYIWAANVTFWDTDGSLSQNIEQNYVEKRHGICYTFLQ